MNMHYLRFVDGFWRGAAALLRLIGLCGMGVRLHDWNERLYELGE
jgi:hypothetical protein